MDPLTISAILQGSKMAYELGTGISQGIKGKKLADSAVRPVYKAPESAQKALSNAEAMAGASMFPGQERAEENIYAGTSQALTSAEGAAESSSDFLGALSGISGNQQNALRGVADTALKYQDTNKQRLNEALMSMANYEDKAFELNQYQPFIDQTNAARALKGASKENISNAFGSAAKTASMLGGLSGGAEASVGNISPQYYTPNSPANPSYIAPQKFEPWNPDYKSADMLTLF